jgi:hypothetical protein
MFEKIFFYKEMIMVPYLNRYVVYKAWGGGGFNYW